MQIKIWANFSKKKNSTKRPDTLATNVDVVLKQPTSIESPTFILSGITSKAFVINYVQWNNHFYFVDNVTILNNDNIEIECSQDILATYKNEIGSYEAFVERSASSYDTNINDPLLSSQQKIILSGSADTTLAEFSANGCYIVRIVGYEGVRNYVFTSLTHIKDIFNYEKVFGEGFNIDNLKDAAQNVGVTVFNPFQYILSVMWVPVTSTSASSTGGSSIYAGWWDTGVTASHARDIVNGNFTLNKPNSAYSDFRSASPSFTQINVYLPGVGTVSLDPLEYSHGSVNGSYVLDLNTGGIIYTLRDSNNKQIGSYEGQLGVPVQIGNTNISSGTFTSALSSLGSAVVNTGIGAVTGGVAGAVAGAVGSIGSNIVDTVKGVIAPSPSVNGSMGNRGKYLLQPNIKTSVFYLGSKDFPTTVNGRPLFKNVVINTLSGYIKCGGASVEVDGLGNDKDLINAYLNSGFYFE